MWMGTPYLPLKHIVTNRNSFMVTPNCMRILYNTSLLIDSWLSWSLWIAGILSRTSIFSQVSEECKRSSCLLVLCLHCPVWSPVLSLNLIYILMFLHSCHEQTCPIHTSNIPASKRHVRFLALRSFMKRIHPASRLLVFSHSKLIFYGKELLAPCPTPKLEDDPLSAGHGYLSNIFVAILHIWRSSPPFATWGTAMPCWEGTHLS
jgi:hypothetical protein